MNVGDEVRLFDVNDRRGSSPDGRVGHVVKIGRKLVTIEGGRYTQVYRLDTQQENDIYGHGWFRTIDQVAEEARQRAAVKTLNAVNLRPSEMGHRCTLTLEQLEAVAALVASFTDESVQPLDTSASDH